MARGFKTGGRVVGSKNKRGEGVEAFARSITTDPEYRQTLVVRARAGTLPPAVEVMLWHYAHGKPVERLEHTGADGQPLRILYGRADKTSLV